MPNLPKRPPARIRAFLLALLPLFVVAAAAAPAHAQTAALWFAPHGKTPPQSAALTVLDAGSSRAGKFKVDVMYGDDAAAQFLRFELHLNSAKLKLLGVENVAATYLSPAANPESLAQTAYADYQSVVGAPAPDDGDEATDSLIYPGWGALREAMFNSATLTSPARLLTLNLQWLPGATGAAKLHFTTDAGDLTGIKTYALTSLTVQGPSD